MFLHSSLFKYKVFYYYGIVKHIWTLCFINFINKDGNHYEDDYDGDDNDDDYDSRYLDYIVVQNDIIVLRSRQKDKRPTLLVEQNVIAY